MKRILITGGAGFIGSHLTETLLAQGHHVTVVDDESTGSSSNLAHLQTETRLNYVQGDIGDIDLVRKVTSDVDQVYHLAAAVGVALIAKEPLETIERIIYPTQLLFGELRKRIEHGEALRVFLASTSEVYGKNSKETWTEEDDLVFGATTKPRWSYGVSKAIDEFLALACWRQFQLPVVIGRFFNVVGPRQSGAYGMVLPRFVQAARDNQPLIVHDDGQQIRCFAHVHDVIGAVLQLMETDEALGKVFNIGSDQPVSIEELAKTVIRLSDSPSQIQFQSYTDAYDADFEDIRRRVPDLSRLQKTIDYQPEYNLEAIVQQLINS